MYIKLKDDKLKNIAGGLYTRIQENEIDHLNGKLKCQKNPKLENIKISDKNCILDFNS